MMRLLLALGMCVGCLGCSQQPTVEEQSAALAVLDREAKRTNELTALDKEGREILRARMKAEYLAEKGQNTALSPAQAQVLMQGADELQKLIPRYESVGTPEALAEVDKTHAKSLEMEKRAMDGMNEWHRLDTEFEALMADATSELHALFDARCKELKTHEMLAQQEERLLLAKQRLAEIEEKMK